MTTATEAKPKLSEDEVKALLDVAEAARSIGHSLPHGSVVRTYLLSCCGIYRDLAEN
jgi:hypothetical protein